MAQSFPRPTKTYRAESYAAIDPTRPKLSLKGQTLLITGGATGIGLATSKAFAQAGVETIVMIARTQGLMLEAKKPIEEAFPDTKVVTHAVSVTDFHEINEIVQNIGTIDILVLNHGFLHKPTPVLELSMSDGLKAFEVNVLGPLNMIQAFSRLQPRSPESPRTIIYTSTLGINFVMHGVAGYSASKAAMTYLMQAVHEEVRGSNIRSFAFHPATAYTPMAKDVLGFGPDSVPFDSVDLPAHYAVWLASAEADYLQGRFLSANWDVNELNMKRDSINEDAQLLKLAVNLGGLVE